MDHLHRGHETVRRPSTTTGHEEALRSVRKPPSKPWRAGGGLTPTPPRVYRVEPREFRDLVQRLTGAPAPARHQHLVAQPVAVRATGGGGEDAARQMYPFPLMARGAAVHPGLDGQQLI